MTKPIPAEVAERAATRYEVDPETGCHLSTYSIASHGYAQIGWQDPESRATQGTTAHRAAYVHFTGEQIPGDSTVDHTCHRRPCVKADNLRLLTNEENARRNGPDRDFPIEWACRRNHPATERTRIARRTKAGERRWGWTCGACARIARQSYIDRQEAAA